MHNFSNTKDLIIKDNSFTDRDVVPLFIIDKHISSK